MASSGSRGSGLRSRSDWRGWRASPGQPGNQEMIPANQTEENRSLVSMVTGTDIKVASIVTACVP